ncbi:MAG: hypothetical protein ACYTG1_08780 [Planctomycetota bacterium]|jgi:hypothetical protein
MSAQSVARPPARRRLAGGVCLATCLTGIAVLALGGAPARAGQTQVDTTVNDFFQPGTQPGDLDVNFPIQPSVNCSGCHGGYTSSGWPA